MARTVQWVHGADVIVAVLALAVAGLMIFKERQDVKVPTEG